MKRRGEEKKGGREEKSKIKGREKKGRKIMQQTIKENGRGEKKEKRKYNKKTKRHRHILLLWKRT